MSRLLTASSNNRIMLTFIGIMLWLTGSSQNKFRVAGFFTAEHDQAHISFVHEANRWFSEMARYHNFTYDSTSNWDNLNDNFLKDYQVVVFLDTRPDSADQRAAFERYIARGGGWMGFHFAAFALTPSTYPQNWNWYHNKFLGSGQYKSNTWRPTSANLRVEVPKHPVTKGLPAVVESSPNEWYCWENDLRKNKNITILLSIDESSFPVGTGPKQHEIWHNGDYPVVWTNKQFNMIYFNMGHNDIDYEHNTNKELSLTFHNASQDSLVLNALRWLTSSRK